MRLMYAQAILYKACAEVESALPPDIWGEHESKQRPLQKGFPQSPLESRRSSLSFHWSKRPVLKGPPVWGSAPSVHRPTYLTQQATQ